MMSYYIIQLEKGVFLAPWKGDPGRTLKQESAKRFSSDQSAITSLNKLKKDYSKFKNAEAVLID